MKKALFIAAVILPTQVYAAQGVYFGFKLGQDTPQQAAATLTQRHSNFQKNFGYRGYSQLLPVFKVTGDSKFNRFKGFRHAWLEFGPGPHHRLYRLSAQWSGGRAHESFTLLRDGLSVKYPIKSPCSGFGFKKSCVWQDQKGKTQIELTHDRFNGVTRLTYTWRPLLPAVKKAKQEVDRLIRQKNAQKAGQDL